MLNSHELQLYKTKISILTIPRENFWIFKSGILQILYKLIDNMEGHSSDEDQDDHENDEFENDGPSSPYESGDEQRSNSSNSNSNKLSNSIHSLTLNNSVMLQNEENEKKKESQQKRDDDSQYSNSSENIEVEDDGLFFHLAFTPEEVTLMCSTKLIKKFLSNALTITTQIPEMSGSQLLGGEFLVLQVLSDGLNIGKKILELTQPLSLNDISIFFISNYFSDVVLIPADQKEKILKILEEEQIKEDQKVHLQQQVQDGFNIEERSNSVTTSAAGYQLETRTFDLFSSSSIKPQLNKNVKLLLTGARSGDSSEVLRKTTESLSKYCTEQNSSSLLAASGPTRSKKADFPSYFAITRTPTEEIGLLLPLNDKEFLKMNYSKSSILGSMQDYYYPLFIDLKKLPIDSKGIVAGVASKLLRLGLTEMSYLSFGKSGVVLIPDNFDDAAFDGILIDMM